MDLILLVFSVLSLQEIIFCFSRNFFSVSHTSRSSVMLEFYVRLMLTNGLFFMFFLFYATNWREIAQLFLNIFSSWAAARVCDKRDALSHDQCVLCVVLHL